MKTYLALISLISLLSSFYSLPHFIYDGIESYHECLEDIDKISFTIYGSISEEIHPSKMQVPNYIIDDMGEFQCSLLKNEEAEDEKRSHKIMCSIIGINFEKKAYIIEEMTVHGFDFLNDKGESTWPHEPEKKTFLIGECGEKKELNKEPLLLGNLADYVNPIKNVRKDIIEKAISNLPSRTSVDLDNMINLMKNVKKSNSLSQVETAFLVYKWMTDNIEYDCYALHHMEVPAISPKDVYEKGKTICAGYTDLFKVICDSLDIETYYVIGYAKGASWVEGQIPRSTNHAWNVIKLDSSYYLLDVTWGSGGCNGDDFSKSYREFYFCSRPEAFIRTHLPAEEKWQLVSPTISLQQFVDMLSIEPEFFEFGFRTVSPDTPFITTDGKFTINLTYESKVKLITGFNLISSGVYEEQPKSFWVEYQQKSVAITFRPNYKGNYKINLFADKYPNYYFLLSYNINCTKTASAPFYYPTAYEDFYSFEMQIIEPFYNPLIRGNFINIKFKSSLVDNLYIRNSKYTRELDNNGKGEFTTEDFYIVGEDIYVTTTKDDKTHFLIKYTTIRDSGSSIDAFHPGSMTSIKNVLYSPLLETLQIGKSYYFKIKCESATKMAVREGNDFTYLDKSGSMFSGFVKIKGVDNNIYIFDDKGNSRDYFYVYNTSK